MRIGDKVEVVFEPLSDSYAVLRFRWLGPADTDTPHES